MLRLPWCDNAAVILGQQHGPIHHYFCQMIVSAWCMVRHRLDKVNPLLGQRCSRSPGPGNLWIVFFHVWFSMQFLHSCPLWCSVWCDLIESLAAWGGPAEDGWCCREATSHFSQAVGRVLLISPTPWAQNAWETQFNLCTQALAEQLGDSDLRPALAGA